MGNEDKISYFKKWVPNFIRNAIIAFALASAGTLLLPNRFTSTGRILPGDAKGAGSMGGLAAAAANLGFAMPTGDSADAAYIDILSSYWLRSALLDSTFTFKSRSSRFGAERTVTMTLRAFTRARNTDLGLRALDRILSVNRDLKTRLITVDATTVSPTLSQAIVKRVLQLLDTFVVERAMTKGRLKAKFAEGRLRDAKVAKAEAERELVKFLSVNRNYLTSADPAVRVAGLRLEEEMKLRGQLVVSLAMGYEQALMDEKNDMPIINVLDAGNQPEQKSGPARANLVLVCTFLVALASLLWDKREFIKNSIMRD